MSDPDETKTPATKAPAAPQVSPPGGGAQARPAPPPMPPEIDGPKGPEPTRFGDWERKGRVSDF